MDNTMQIVSDTAQNTANAIDNLLSGVSLWQIALVAVLLLILAIILICALSSRGRKCEQLLDEKEKEGFVAQRAEKAAGDQLQKAADEAQRIRAESASALSHKDETISELKSNVDELSRFHDEYAAIPDAKAEAARIVREAKDHAYVVSNRTEMEYAEIIEHANQEAESIRNLAQQRLTRSHEALKAALARANEIIDEAHGEASRVAQIAYIPGPSLIEAPAKQTQTGEEPESTKDEE